MKHAIATPTGERLACEVSGSGVPMVFVHGWACNRSFWRASAVRLEGSYQVVSLDLAEHGESSSLREDWTIPSFASDVVQVVEGLDLRGAILVGHSMGGLAALEAARNLGGRLRGVVMVDSFLFDYGHLSPKRVRELMIPFRRNLHKALLRLVENTALSGMSKESVHRIAQQMAKTSPGVAIAALESLFTWNAMPAFESAPVPVVWISGQLIDPAARERYAGFVTEEVILPGGHFLMYEVTETFNMTLEKVVAALSETPAD